MDDSAHHRYEDVLESHRGRLTQIPASIFAMVERDALAYQVLLLRLTPAHQQLEDLDDLGDELEVTGLEFAVEALDAA